jgi:hypothetical protein
MKWPVTFASQVLVSALIATLLLWSFYSGGNRVTVYRTGWLGGLSKLPDKAAVWTRALILLVIMFSFGDVVSILEPFVYKVLAYLMLTLGLAGIHVAIGAGVIVAGMCAYIFKLRNQALYGIVEIVVAGATGIAVAKKIGTVSQWTGSMQTLVAAIYVVSRGAGNYFDGLEKRRKKIHSLSESEVSS